MDYKSFTKTLLNVYNSLDAVCNRIDKMVDSKAIGAGLGCSAYRNSLDLFNNIIDLSERKVHLINLKLRIEQAITKLNQKEAKILILKFVDRLTFQQIANLNDQSLRNCFRICENGINNLGKILKVDGLTEDKIMKDYANEKWLFQIYDMQPKSKEKNDHSECVFLKSPIITGRDIIKIASKRVLSL